MGRCKVDAKLLSVERVFGSDEVHRQLVPRHDLAGREEDPLGVSLVVAMRVDIVRRGDPNDRIELVTQTDAGLEFVEHHAEPQSVVIDDAGLSGLNGNRARAEAGRLAIEVVDPNQHDAVIRHQHHLPVPASTIAERPPAVRSR